MKELTRTQTSTLTGGGWLKRLERQAGKCAGGSDRACRRASRIAARHGIDFIY